MENYYEMRRILLGYRSLSDALSQNASLFCIFLVKTLK